MSEKIGPVAFEGSMGRPMFGMGVSEREYSENVASEIDNEVTRIMTESRERAKQVLTAHRKAFEVLARRLIEVETIEREEYDKLMLANGIEPKKGYKGQAIAA
jgi:cell division protease FtsH